MGCKGSRVRIPPSRPLIALKINSLAASASRLFFFAGLDLAIRPSFPPTFPPTALAIAVLADLLFTGLARVTPARLAACPGHASNVTADTFRSMLGPAHWPNCDGCRASVCSADVSLHANERDWPAASHPRLHRVTSVGLCRRRCNSAPIRWQGGGFVGGPEWWRWR